MEQAGNLVGCGFDSIDKSRCSNWLMNRSLGFYSSLSFMIKSTQIGFAE
tara:strand:- start:2758 stop:2904 length:147 start_codon:yes stop_codon:yes gene_type:complete